MAEGETIDFQISLSPSVIKALKLIKYKCKQDWTDMSLSISVHVRRPWPACVLGPTTCPGARPKGRTRGWRGHFTCQSLFILVGAAVAGRVRPQHLHQLLLLGRHSYWVTEEEDRLAMRLKHRNSQRAAGFQKWSRDWLASLQQEHQPAQRGSFSCWVYLNRSISPVHNQADF